MLKGTSVLRENNKRKVLSLVRRLKQTTRKDLVKEADVSKNTISLVVDELINDGVLKEVGIKEPNKKGRPKVLIQIKSNSYKSVGITVSKQFIAYSVINYDGELIEENSIVNDGTNTKTTIRLIIQILESLIKSYEMIIGVGIGIPGIVNERELKVLISTHLNWKDVSLNHFSHLNIPIIIQNSVNMGAHSAMNDELLFDNESIFYIRVSEGVGGAYIIDNVVMSGETWTAGEIGHISVDPLADKCQCGQKGCLESLINIEQFKNEMLMKNIQFNEDNGFYISLDNNKHITETIGQYGFYLGKSLVSVMHLLNPKTVIVDTPYNNFNSFREECLNYLQKHCLDRVYKGTRIIYGNERYNMSRGAALSTIINFEKYVH